MAESTSSIITAASANLAIAIAKFTGAALTGSASMLAEGVHSVVDTANQGLLLFGLHRAKRPADVRHPFGYGRELYFYSFVVALLIFLAGGLYSVHEGIAKLQHPEATGDVSILGKHLPALAVNLGILGFAICAEGYSLFVAYRSLPKGGGSPISAVRRSKDPSLFVTIVEDTAAVAGLLIAALGVGLSELLGLPMLDGAASIAIGVVLVGMAFFLMVETHGLLLGEAADPRLVAAIESIVRAEPKVHAVNEILTQHLGPSDILVNISLDIDDSISGGEVEAVVGRLEAGLRAEHSAVGRVFIEIQSTDSSRRAAGWRKASSVA